MFEFPFPVQDDLSPMSGKNSEFCQETRIAILQFPISLAIIRQERKIKENRLENEWVLNA